MQLTTKVEYTIRALTELANSSTGNPVKLRQICENQNLPLKYMEHLFSRLKKAAIVRSVHGSYGGYLLKISPDRLSIKDIIAAVDDNFVALNCCRDKGRREYCIGRPCHFSKIWNEIKEDLDKYLGTIPLSKFIET